MNPDQANAIQQHLTDNLNSNAQISAYCSAIATTTVAPSAGAWYPIFTAALKTAQAHASQYINHIGPDCWSTIPSAIVHYGQAYQSSLAVVQEIMQAAAKRPAPNANVLTPGEMSGVQRIFWSLSDKLIFLLGMSGDSNLAKDGTESPTAPTIYGCLNDLKAFNVNITNDNEALTEGQDGAANEVNLLAQDEATITADIQTLTGEISVWNQDIAASEVGIGVSIFVAVAGFALDVATGGAALVATGVGIAGLGGSIAAAAVYSEKVKAAQNKIVADQATLTTEQQQVAQLNAIILSLQTLDTKNLTAQGAVGGIKQRFTDLVTESQATLAKMEAADAATMWSIVVDMNINDSLKAWAELVKTAQDILDTTLSPQTLAPPSPTVS